MHSKYFAIEKYLECKLHLKLIVFYRILSIERTNFSSARIARRAIK